MQELYALKPVSENDIDSLFMEVERITVLYLKASVSEDPMLEQWVVAAIMRNLPKQLTRDLALELKKANRIDDIHICINIYMYDHQTGMPRNMFGPMLCTTEQEAQGKTPEDQPDRSNPTNSIAEPSNTNKEGQDDWELYAIGKGGKGIGKGKGNGKRVRRMLALRRAGSPEARVSQAVGGAEFKRSYIGVEGRKEYWVERKWEKGQRRKRVWIQGQR